MTPRKLPVTCGACDHFSRWNDGECTRDDTVSAERLEAPPANCPLRKPTKDEVIASLTARLEVAERTIDRILARDPIAPIGNGDMVDAGWVLMESWTAEKTRADAAVKKLDALVEAAANLLSTDDVEEGRESAMEHAWENLRREVKGLGVDTRSKP